MSLSKTTDLGLIAINDSVIARAILRATSPVSEKLFLSTEKGKIIGAPDKVRKGELVGNFDIEENEDKYILKFYIVMNFGASIKKNTEAVFDALEKEMKTIFPEKGAELIIKIVGIKASNVAERNIEVTRKYEA